MHINGFCTRRLLRATHALRALPVANPLSPARMAENSIASDVLETTVTDACLPRTSVGSAREHLHALTLRLRIGWLRVAVLALMERFCQMVRTQTHRDVIGGEAARAPDCDSLAERACRRRLMIWRHASAAWAEVQRVTLPARPMERFLSLTALLPAEHAKPTIFVPSLRALYSVTRSLQTNHAPWAQRKSLMPLRSCTGLHVNRRGARFTAMRTVFSRSEAVHAQR